MMVGVRPAKGDFISFYWQTTPTSEGSVLLSNEAARWLYEDLRSLLGIDDDDTGPMPPLSEYMITAKITSIKKGSIDNG